jgi:hypothetical protein
MAEINSTPSIKSLANDVARNLNDVHDLIELMYETYGDDGETKVGALCTVTLRSIDDALRATYEIDNICKRKPITEGGAT